MKCCGNQPEKKNSLFHLTKLLIISFLNNSFQYRIIFVHLLSFEKQTKDHFFPRKYVYYYSTNTFSLFKAFPNNQCILTAESENTCFCQEQELAGKDFASDFYGIKISGLTRNNNSWNMKELFHAETEMSSIKKVIILGI